MDREAKTGLRYDHNIVPETTMCHNINDVFSKFDFNMLNTVSNKSQSRVVADHSVRSTVSYILAVLTTHYIHAVPTEFHLLKKELDKDPTYKLIVELNEEILGEEESGELIK